MVYQGGYLSYNWLLIKDYLLKIDFLSGESQMTKLDQAEKSTAHLFFTCHFDFSDVNKTPAIDGL